ASLIYPNNFAINLLKNNNILNNSSKELIVLFTGDTQYHFPCVTFNQQCKEKSKNCTGEKIEELIYESTTIKTTKQSDLPFPPPKCVFIESSFANEIQRKAIYRLIRILENNKQKPSALVINGDLTNFGHSFQLELFKIEWLQTIQIPLLIGLGNHDYENNVNDCIGNNCADRMLRWFAEEYAPSMRTFFDEIDLERKTELWRYEFEGSLAYTANICLNNNCLGEECIYSIQLHNRPDYATLIKLPYGHWQIRSSFNWLNNELNRITELLISKGKTSSIVLINLHNNNDKVGERLKRTLENWNKFKKSKQINLFFIILFAHIHQNHFVNYKCINKQLIPHIFVGSVPNNRFTLIKFKNNENKKQNAQIFLFQANSNSTLKIVEQINFEWPNCL
ncbi:Metallophos domain-containing protein, partial [Meloidogyne graminicola]